MRLSAVDGPQSRAPSPDPYECQLNPIMAGEKAGKGEVTMSTGGAIIGA